MNKKFKKINLTNKKIRTIKYNLKKIINKYTFIPTNADEHKKALKNPLEYVFLHSSREGAMFIKSKGYFLLLKIDKLIENDNFIKENISDYKVNAELNKIIMKSLKSGTVDKLVDDLLSEFDNFEGKHKLTFIIEGLSLIDLEEFYIGDVVFKKIDGRIATQFYADTPSTQAIIEERKHKIIGKTIAEFIASGDDEKSRKKALFAIQQAINVVRFYYTWGNWYRALHNRNFQVNIAGYQQGGNEDFMIEDLLSKRKTRVYGRGVSLLQNFEVSLESLTKLKENQLDDFSDLLKQEKPNELERALLNSLYWTGDAINDSNKLSSYIKFIISLETLFNLDKNRSKLTEKFARCVAIASGTNAEEMKSIYHEIKKDKGLYDLRSIIVHQGELVNVPLEKIARLASTSFVRMLGLRKNGYTAKNQIFSEINRLSKICKILK